jgi:glycerophosphoryl diester phosphodiesterase
VHDRRLERTSNGRGRVSGRTLAELDALDFGSWHPGDDDPDPDRDSDRIRLLTLNRLLAAVRDAGRDVHLLIETKHPTRYGSWVERRLAQLLARYGLADPRPGDPVRATVMSFSPLALRTMHTLAPALTTALLLEVLPPGMRPGRLPFGTRIAAPSVRLLRTRPSLVEMQRTAGNQVYVWTVNDPADVTWVIDLGIDGIITDRPREVLHQLGRGR